MSAPAIVRPVPVPAEAMKQVMKRLRESSTPSYCPSCGEGDESDRKELCRMCDLAEDVEQLRKEVTSLRRTVSDMGYREAI